VKDYDNFFPSNNLNEEKAFYHGILAFQSSLTGGFLQVKALSNRFCF